MLERLAFNLAGIVLMPLCWGVAMAVFRLVRSIDPEIGRNLPPTFWALIGGFMLWQILYLTLPRPARLYVLGHELTHALWGWLMGARVSKLKVGRDHGSVTLSKTNVWITLAPYFFPLYTFIVITVYYVLSIFLEVERAYLVWLALVGFTWGFHATFTLVTLLQRQSDILAYGRILSYTLILLLNVLGIGFWVVMVSEATLEKFVMELNQCAGMAYRWGLDILYRGFVEIRHWAGTVQ
ncbi:MAG: hypothetical protein A2498_02150 [Lentisphaerae bacterium RIFOXYC12_FULL_60_16]|nr:MAG: hypothetical protein A2498_02150 [Lentisphaerae bacterium RIFOXYC12_FULL_60_16]OGV77832.1 MAG: hypothetical protein A2340_10075 [Lentisphaerae bacterium RIFOXYB12_FULL_60_10]